MLSKTCKIKSYSTILVFALQTKSEKNSTWIWDACRSIVIIWSAPAIDNMFATSFAEIGALLW